MRRPEVPIKENLINRVIINLKITQAKILDKERDLSKIGDRKEVL